MRINLKPYLVTLFMLGLIIATYRGLAEIYILVIFISAILYIIGYKSGKLKLNNKFSWWLIFVVYYLISSFAGLITKYVGLDNLIEFILKYVCLPIILFVLMPNSKTDLIKTLKLFRNFILISSIYGLIESLLKYNYMVNFVILQSKSWMNAMNISNNYQSSSVFLHYNYYGCFLIIGWLLLQFIPCKNKFINNFFKILIIEQILICQSRISWIAFVVLLLVQILKSRKITNKKIQILIVLSGLVIIACIFDPLVLTKLISFISSRFAKLWIYGFQDGSLGQRVGTLLNWPEYLGDNLILGILGSGYQSIHVKYMDSYSYFAGYSTADCELTVFLVETGIIGTSIFICAIISELKKRHNNIAEVELGKYALIVFIVEAMTLDIAASNIALALFYIMLLQGYKFNKCSKYLHTKV